MVAKGTSTPDGAGQEVAQVVKDIRGWPMLTTAGW